MPDHLCDPYDIEFVGKPPDRAEATCCGRKWYLTKKGWSDTPPLEIDGQPKSANGTLRLPQGVGESKFSPQHRQRLGAQD